MFYTVIQMDQFWRAQLVQQDNGNILNIIILKQF